MAHLIWCLQGKGDSNAADKKNDNKAAAVSADGCNDTGIRGGKGL
ncbi:MAG: hypothetical protein REI12_01455 [Pedobacter sp.]|nr:hypothetical protein [Pedobacter sp.]